MGTQGWQNCLIWSWTEVGLSKYRLITEIVNFIFLTKLQIIAYKRIMIVPS